MKAVRTDQAPAPVGPYSQAVIHGGWVFVSGQIPLTPSGEMEAGGVEAQTRRVLANLRTVLEAAGSSLDRVLRTTVYLADLGDFAAVNAVYGEHFTSEPQPARVALQAAALPKGALVEIDAIAVLP